MPYDSAMHDLRFALRLLYRNPGFTLVAVAALALGIGANTAIFSVVNSILLRPLPYRAPDRLVNLYEANLGRGWTHITTSGSTFMQWRDQAKSFEDMLLMERGSATITGVRRTAAGARHAGHGEFLRHAGRAGDAAAAPFARRKDTAAGTMSPSSTHAYWMNGSAAIAPR